MRAWLVGLSLIGLSAAAAASCVVAPYDLPTATGGDGGSGDSGSTATSTSGSNQGPGGTGGATSSTSSTDVASSSSTGGGGCTKDADCANLKVPICYAAACEGNVCIKKAITDTTDQKPDAIGDCKLYACVMGVLQPHDLLDDPPDDGNPCTLDSCNAMNPDPPPVTCPLPNNGGDGVCYQFPGGPVCLGCVPDTSCGISNICSKFGQCLSPTCNDTVKDGDESDADCGGSCTPCVPNRMCNQDTDCASKKCSGGLCAMRSCSDGKKNGEETGVDCGGICLPLKCPINEGCRTDDDCESSKCYGGICQAPSCTDNKKNGDETGIDCGGSCEHSCGG